jgi:hypothetical protein
MLARCTSSQKSNFRKVAPRVCGATDRSSNPLRRLGDFYRVLFGNPRCTGRARETREYVFLRLRSNLDRAEEWPVDDDIGQFEKISDARSPVISVWAPKILGVEEKVTETRQDAATEQNQPFDVGDNAFCCYQPGTPRRCNNVELTQNLGRLHRCEQLAA